jgi:hypothetical protein
MEHACMKPTVSTFTSIYTEWLDTFRAMIPGGSHKPLAGEPTPKEAQIAANQEWEDEGGSIKPEKNK